MKLIELSMKNFMPYRGAQSIRFPEDPQRNVLVLLGDNMRGKTSLLNAIRWCFYGIAYGRHLVEIPLQHLVNIEAARAGEWTVEVAIRFEADGHDYEMRRRAVKQRLVATPERPEHFDVSVLLRRDGSAVIGHEIEGEINRFAPQQVSRFFLFDGELLQEYETLLIEGSDQGRRIKEAIEQVLGVPALLNGRDDAAVLLKRAQKQQNADLAHIKGVEAHVQSQAAWQEKQEAYERDLRALREGLKKLREEREALDDEVESSESTFQAKASLDQNERHRKELIEEQNRLRKEKLELLGDAWRDLVHPQITQKLRHLEEEQRRLTDAISDRGALDGEIQKLKQLLLLSICPTCGQSVTESHRTECGARLGELESILKAKSIDQSHMRWIASQISVLGKLARTGVSSLIKDRQINLSRLDVALTKVENEIERLKENLAGFDTAEVARKRSLRANLLKEEGNLEGEIQGVQKKVEGAKKELEIIGRQFRNSPEARAERSTALVALYSGLEKSFGASVEHLRDSLRKSVEEKATHAFRAMITQRAYLGLRINENYGLTIIDETGHPVSIRSAGAEQIVALSLIDGLSHTGRTTGPVVMDTPFGRLDLKHRDNILRYLPQTASQLVLLVHDGEIRGDQDLAPLAHRIGAEYVIREVSPRHSIVERKIR